MNTPSCGSAIKTESFKYIWGYGSYIAVPSEYKVVITHGTLAIMKFGTINALIMSS